MQDFLIYFNMGLKHVLDINAYDHVLFFIALTIPYNFKDWKRVLALVTVFTIAHTISLILSVFEIITIKANIVEFLIPITILITALYYLFTAGKTSKKDNISFVLFITAFFGIIHGLGFSNYFKTIMMGTKTDKLIPLLEFAIGIEVAQVLVVLVVLVFGYITQTVFRFSKRDWALILSAFIIGVVLPMILQGEIFE